MDGMAGQRVRNTERSEARNALTLRSRVYPNKNYPLFYNTIDMPNNVMLFENNLKKSLKK
jgi:hypothetical protein